MPFRNYRLRSLRSNCSLLIHPPKCIHLNILSQYFLRMAPEIDVCDEFEGIFDKGSKKLFCFDTIIQV